MKEVLTCCYEGSVIKVYFIDKYLDLSTSTVVPKGTGKHIYIKQNNTKDNKDNKYNKDNNYK